MRKLALLIWVFLTVLSVFGFSKVGVSKTQIAPYTVLQKDGEFEV